MTARLVILSGLLFLVRLASAVVVSQPGYTDSYYFTDVADRLAHGLGLSADFLWSPVEAPPAPGDLVLPVASHLFWVPLPTALAAAGIALLGGVADTFRAAQAPFILLAAALPAVTWSAARSLGAGERWSLTGAALAGLGGIFAPGLVAVDAFAPAALLGTVFFLLYARAAAGSARAGALAGGVVGLLYLTRSEGALFGLALLALALVPRARKSALAGSGVAISIGIAWIARDMSLGIRPDLFARTALLVRYEDFFAYGPEYFPSAGSAVADFLGAKAAALVANLGTFAFSFALVLLVPLVAGIRDLRRRADVRAWAGLAVLAYLAESLVWTLHSTRGSYFHSLAAFFPFGLAIAAAGAERVLQTRAPQMSAAWAWGTVILVAVLSGGAVSQWDSVFNSGTRTRLAALDAIPPGPFLAIDAAAWRWIGGRAVAVTPADGLGAAGCVALRVNARSVVLESAHFSGYEQLYRGDGRPAWLDPPIERGSIKIYAIRGEPACAGAP